MKRDVTSPVNFATTPWLNRTTTIDLDRNSIFVQPHLFQDVRVGVGVAHEVGAGTNLHATIGSRYMK